MKEHYGFEPKRRLHVEMHNYRMPSQDIEHVKFVKPNRFFNIVFFLLKALNLWQKLIGNKRAKNASQRVILSFKKHIHPLTSLIHLCFLKKIFILPIFFKIISEFTHWVSLKKATKLQKPTHI